MPSLKTNDRVAFSRHFLQSTGQLTGWEAPTSAGPFARGTVTADETDLGLVKVLWDDARETTVRASNLVRADRLHLERT